MTPQQATFYGTVARLPPAAAVVSLLEARTAASTKATYRAAELLYQASCTAGGMQAWPPPRTRFCSLRESGAFAALGVYFAAVVESARARGQSLAQRPPDLENAAPHRARPNFPAYPTDA